MGLEPTTFAMARRRPPPPPETPTEGPADAGPSEERMMGLEPTTFAMARRRSSQLSYIRWWPEL